MAEKKYILVLGGSTFMGLKLLEKLCNQENEDYQIYHINRGKKYWNSEVKNIKNAYHIFGNRKEKKEYKKLIEYESKKLGINENKKWTAVYDFCAFKYSELNGIIQQYNFKIQSQHMKHQKEYVNSIYLYLQILFMMFVINP